MKTRAKNPNAKRKAFKFHSTEIHHDLLQKRRFENESNQALVNRLLLRVSAALDAGQKFGSWLPEFDPQKQQLTIWNRQMDFIVGQYPAQRRSAKQIIVSVNPLSYCVYNGESFGRKIHPYDFKVGPAVESLLAQYQQDTNQATVQTLLEWALQLPPVGEFQSAEEVMGFLRQFGNQRTAIRDVLERLTNYCSEDNAKSWLWQLHDSGKVRLIQGHDSRLYFRDSQTKSGYQDLIVQSN